MHLRYVVLPFWLFYDFEPICRGTSVCLHIHESSFTSWVVSNHLTFNGTKQERELWLHSECNCLNIVFACCDSQKLRIRGNCSFFSFSTLPPQVKANYCGTISVRCATQGQTLSRIAAWFKFAGKWVNVKGNVSNNQKIHYMIFRWYSYLLTCPHLSRRLKLTCTACNSSPILRYSWQKNPRLWPYNSENTWPV